MGRYEEQPWVSGDEDGNVFVPVTSKTRTLAAARAFLIENADDAGYDPETHRFDADKIVVRRLDLCVLKPVSDQASDAMLPAGITDLPSLIEKGRIEAWWSFEPLDDAAEEIPERVADRDLKWARAAAQRDIEARQRARTDRGPWWWRLQYALADWMNRTSRKLYPDDRDTVIYRDADGESVFKRVRSKQAKGRPF